MQSTKMKHLFIMALHIYHQNCNPCYFLVVRMRIVMQKTIDSGTIAIFFLFLLFTIWPRLTAVVSRCSHPHRRCLYQKSTYLATAVLPAPTNLMLLFLFYRGNIISLARRGSYSPFRRSWSRHPCWRKQDRRSFSAFKRIGFKINAMQRKRSLRIHILVAKYTAIITCKKKLCIWKLIPYIRKVICIGTQKNQLEWHRF
jgi:hypothetical protein